MSMILVRFKDTKNRFSEKRKLIKKACNFCLIILMLTDFLVCSLSKMSQQMSFKQIKKKGSAFLIYNFFLSKLL